MSNCFTIGHSNHPTEKFIRLLREHEVKCVVDVRSIPYSRRNPQYIKDTIKSSLEAEGFEYIFMGDELGARGKGPELMFPDGKVVDFAKVRQTDTFRQGIGQLLGIIDTRTVALMCAERDPYQCHRFMLVSYALCEQGVEVSHILEDAEVATKAELEKRLLDQYFGRSPGLFSGASNNEEAIELAYEKRNKGLK